LPPEIRQPFYTAWPRTTEVWPRESWVKVPTGTPPGVYTIELMDEAGSIIDSVDLLVISTGGVGEGGCRIGS